MIVTDARDVNGNPSTEKGGLPQQKALTLEIATTRERLVNSGALIRWTADENMILNGLTEGPQRVKTAPGSSSPELRMECTTRRLVGSRKVSVSSKAYTKDEFNAHYK